MNNTVVTATLMEWTKGVCQGHQCPLNPLVQSNKHVHDPNQQNAQTCSLDIHMLLSHNISTCFGSQGVITRVSESSSSSSSL